MATMYDSVDPTKIPKDAEIVAGYVNGHWPTYNRLPGLFPNAQLVSIAVTADADAMVLDVEAGDATPDQAPAWITRQRARGGDPTIYCSRASMWPAVKSACALAGVVPPHYWIADYTDHEHLLPGSVATQWTDAGPYDISVTDGTWPATKPPAPPAPTPTPTEAPVPVSPAISFKLNQQDVFQVSGGTLWHKWLGAGTWYNEAVCGPSGGASKARATFPDQTPQVAIIGNQCVVTVEDSSNGCWYFAQGTTTGTWGANRLP